MITETKLWTALITPMDSSGNIHWKDLEHLLQRQQDAGNGILILGSTGEGLAIKDDEKKEVVDFVHDFNPTVPWMVGVGGFQVEKQVEWIEYCNRTRCDALLLVTPIYAKPGTKGLAEWFTRLMDASEKPCMLYNIPSRTGTKMSPGLVKELSAHKNFWSIKEAGGSVKEYELLREHCPDVPLYSGDDGLLPYFSIPGCEGLVSVASNVWPKETSLYVRRAMGGENEQLIQVWSKATEALFSASNPIPAKILLEKKKVISSAAVRLPLSLADLRDYSTLSEADQSIEEWYKNYK